MSACKRARQECLDALRELETRLPGMPIRHLQLPLADPGLPAAVTAAREQGYHLGGLLPLRTDTDVLLMQKVADEADFSALMLLTDQSRRLAAYVRTDRESLKA